MSNTTDRELLELAAKAVGHRVTFTKSGLCAVAGDHSIGPSWNPLMDDGDAFRLAAALKISPRYYDGYVIGWTDGGSVIAKVVEYESDPYSSTRRAIVHAAAEIGKQMP